MRVLLIEDDVSVAKMVALILEREGHEVVATDRGREAIDLARAGGFDIAILDLSLPDLPGEQVITQLRAEGVDTPTLVLSGSAEADVRVQLLRRGADDYLAKPFDQRELVARLHAIERRAKSRPSSVLRIGGLSVDRDSRSARVAEREIPLTGKEYAVLDLLAQRKGMIVAKDALLLHLYGNMDVPGIKIIDVFVCKLRKKLAETPDVNCVIDTIWGRGYQLRAEEEAVSAA